MKPKEIDWDRLNAIIEKYNMIEQRLDKKMEPFQASIDDILVRIDSSQEAMKELMKEDEEEMKKMADSINAFAEEIRKMKDFVRERTIDLEL